MKNIKRGGLDTSLVFIGALILFIFIGVLYKFNNLNIGFFVPFIVVSIVLLLVIFISFYKQFYRAKHDYTHTGHYNIFLYLIALIFLVINIIYIFVFGFTMDIILIFFIDILLIYMLYNNERYSSN